MLRSGTIWLGSLLFAVLVHLSWHLGRPGHDHRSFGLWYHWIIGVVAGWLVAAMAHRRFPEARRPALLFMLGLGVVLGQGLEPLGEVVLFSDSGWAPFTNGLRWRFFGEFLVAAVAAALLAVAMTGRVKSKA